MNQENNMNQNESTGSFRRLLNYAKEYPTLIAQAALLLLLSTAAEVSAPILVKVFIDDFVTQGNFPVNALVTLAMLYIFLHLVSAWSGYMKALKFNQVAFSVIRTLRAQVFGTVIRKPLSFFDHTPTGSLVSRITNDTEAIKDLFVQVIPTFVQNFTLIIGIFIAMAFLDFRLMLVCLFFLPSVILVMYFYQKFSAVRFHRARSVLSQINASINEAIQGMKVIQFMNQQKRFSRKFNRISNNHFAARMDNIQLDGLLLRPMVDLLKILTLGGLLMFFGAQSLTGPVEIGVMYAFLSYLTRFTEPVIEMTQRLNLLQQARVAGERVFTILDGDQEPVTQSTALIDKGVIEFQRLSFGYDSNNPVLKDINHIIPKGEFHAIVGHTGSGKSTLMSLLLRFYRPDTGRVLIDGNAIEFIEDQSLRQGIGIVQQDPFIFVGTFLDNITLGKPLERDQVEAAARQAQIHDFIMSQPQGYDTQMSERGSNLSTGQRQLLTLARTLAHQPRILILDEATANIDSETEAVIQKALAGLRGKVTIVAIAHRLSTITDADQILVLHQGEIKQKGRHQELLLEDNLYRHMYDLQLQSDAFELEGLEVS